MKRLERDHYRLRNKEGKRLCYNANILDTLYQTYEKAAENKNRLEERHEKFANNIVICHEEVYKYFDDNGVFIKEETYTTVVE